MHHFILSDNQEVATISQDKGKRTFTGIANSGKPFIYHGERAIADLSDIAFADKVPALLLHDRDKRVGFGSLSVQNHQLIVSGDLLDNEHGKQIATEADAGFPWQMSAHIIAGYVETLPNGQSVEINGQTITGDIKILRNCRVSEISFTPTGVDNQTMAMILSDFAQNQQAQAPTSTNQPQENTMTTNELAQKISELTQKVTEQDKRISELEAENKTLKDANAKLEADSKKANVEAKLSAKGFVKDDKGNWTGVDSTTFEVLLGLDSDKAGVIIDSLATPKADVPQVLLGENYSDGNANKQTPTSPLLAVIGDK